MKSVTIHGLMNIHSDAHRRSAAWAEHLDRFADLG
jgi:hypothetical protein